MCRLFFHAGGNTHALIRALNVAVGEDGQADGSGALAVLNGKAQVYKAAPDQPWSYGAVPGAAVAPRKMADAIFAGHARSATQGSKSMGNTHPLRSGDAYLMHNGMVYTSYTPLEVGKDETDSYILTRALEAVNGDVAAFGAMLSQYVTGWAAIIAYHAGTRLWYIGRSSAPLYVLADSDEGEVMIATTTEMLAAAKGRRISGTLLPDDHIQTFDPVSRMFGAPHPMRLDSRTTYYGNWSEAEWDKVLKDDTIGTDEPATGTIHANGMPKGLSRSERRRWLAANRQTKVAQHVLSHQRKRDKDKALDASQEIVEGMSEHDQRVADEVTAKLEGGIIQ